MNALRRLLPLVTLLPLLAGCGMFGGDDPTPKPKLAAGPAPVEDLYNNGVDALHDERYALAVKQFDAVEQNYPYSSWAVNAQLMQGYTDYLRNHYDEAIPVLDRFIQLHPAHPEIAYAYYLRSLCYYEQIADTQRDQRGTQEAMSALQDVVNRFPDTPYARDVRLKIDLARDHLAGKEMLIGRYYQEQHLYGAAIGRFQDVVDNFQTTNHVPEALHRLTEIYLSLGMRQQARRTASVLGYNYPGSSWYEDSYNQLLDDKLVTNASAGASAGAFAGASPGASPAPAKAKPGFIGRTFGALF